MLIPIGFRLRLVALSPCLDVGSPAARRYNRGIMPISTKPPQREGPSDPEPRKMSDAPVDIPRGDRAGRESLLAGGEDPDREGLERTPNRVARAYGELLAGLHEDPKRHLKTV